MTIDIVTNANASGAGSLAQTIADATAGDTIDFASGLQNSTFSLGATLDITKNLTIDGESSGGRIALSGQDSFSVLQIESGVTVELSGLYVEHGNATGSSVYGFSYGVGHSGANAAGGIYNRGTLTMSDSYFAFDVGVGGAGSTMASHPYYGGGAGGNAAGGIYNAAGAVLNIQTSSVGFKASSNLGVGGNGGDGGRGFNSNYAGGAGGAGGHSSAGGSSGTAGSAGGSGYAGVSGYSGAGGAPGQPGQRGQYYNVYQPPNTYMFSSPGGGGGGGTGFTEYGGAGSVNIIVACFLRGTLIATEHGQTAIEHLTAGDRVRTLRGDLLPVLWVGHRRYRRNPVASPFWKDIAPVHIRADAIADGVPSRDLLVSPEHSLFLAGHLINAKNLVNGGSIAPDDTISDVEYFHIELERHEVILAENTPAETYLDNGNAGRWDNAAERATPPRVGPAPPEAWYAPHAYGRNPALALLRAVIAARTQPHLAA
jgi:hypothetical protein